jgi:squalene-hopene/tetraprenyl-beta-curcumene cyclase
LRAQQTPGGAWWGRWSANFLWSTAHAVGALVESGEPRDGLSLRRARAFFLSHQNGDGGFGETEASYRDPSLAGVGPSMPPVTACVLEALVALGDAASPAATRAARYLIGSQRPGGDWSQGGHLQVIIPPELFYSYPGSGHQVVLNALAAYRAALRAPATRARLGASLGGES